MSFTLALIIGLLVAIALILADIARTLDAMRRSTGRD